MTLGDRDRGLVLDFGGPVLVTPFERLDAVRKAYGLSGDALDWRGPFSLSPDDDPLWTDMQSGRISEPEYWERRAAEFDRLTGGGGLRELMKVMYDGPDSAESDLVRPVALRAMAAAKSAGMKVGVLTNDLTAFHSADWIDRMPLFGGIDALVDASVDGVRKPEVAAYDLISDRLGLRPEDAVFVDDQPANVAGAQRTGMTAILLDVTDPEDSFTQALAALGLLPPGPS